jgi:hypothetical protein
MGECPILLHEEAEYDKFRNLNCSGYAYVENNTEIRITMSSSHPNIIALVYQHQQYGDSGEGAGLPQFQGVCRGVRAIVESIPIPVISALIKQTCKAIDHLLPPPPPRPAAAEVSKRQCTCFNSCLFPHRADKCVLLINVAKKNKKNSASDKKQTSADTAATTAAGISIAAAAVAVGVAAALAAKGAKQAEKAEKEIKKLRLEAAQPPLAHAELVTHTAVVEDIKRLG